MIIDLFADIACPWCYVGERRLRRALEARGVEPVLRWRPFELQPGLPKEGIPWADLVEGKFGGWERARPLFDRVAETGASDGIRFDFTRMAAAPNTRDAHRLVLLAQQHGKAWETAEALFSACFERFRNVSRHDVLSEVAADVGLDAARVREVLEGADFSAEVQTSQEVAAAMGVQGVPFVLFEGRLAVSGAQTQQVFEGAIEKAREMAA